MPSLFQWQITPSRGFNVSMSFQHGSSPRIMGWLLLALSQHECRVTFWSSTTARFLQSSVSPEERGVMWGKISEMRCGITGKDSNKPERRWRMGLPSCGRQIRFFCDSLVSRERACSGREKEKGIPLFSIDPKGESRDFTNQSSGAFGSEGLISTSSFEFTYIS